METSNHGVGYQFHFGDVHMDIKARWGEGIAKKRVADILVL